MNVIKVTEYVKNNQTGEIRVLDGILPAPDGVPFLFGWSEGNFSCDCNRQVVFDGEDLDMACGKGAYSVSIRNRDGDYLYDEIGLSNE